MVNLDHELPINISEDSTVHPIVDEPCVGLTAGLQEGQQNGIVLITAVIQCFLVEVGQKLHPLQTVRRSRMGAQPL